MLTTDSVIFPELEFMILCMLETKSAFFIERICGINRPFVVGSIAFSIGLESVETFLRFGFALRKFSRVTTTALDDRGGSQDGFSTGIGRGFRGAAAHCRLEYFFYIFPRVEEIFEDKRRGKVLTFVLSVLLKENLDRKYNNVTSY